MDNNKKQEIKNATEEQLLETVAGLRKGLQKLRFEKAIRGVTDSSQFGKMRVEIAQALTEIRSRELSEYTAEELEDRSRIRARRARNKK
jgi:ribosomal protein L29